eukprot:Amastigsp_a508909_11.p1 type:complete len:389 gc:universal Amastigsp_a508909_11:70-1236(+)
MASPRPKRKPSESDDGNQAAAELPSKRQRGLSAQKQTPQSTGKKRCPHCDAPLPPSAKTCSACASPQPAVVVHTRDDSYDAGQGKFWETPGRGRKQCAHCFVYVPNARRICICSADFAAKDSRPAADRGAASRPSAASGSSSAASNEDSDNGKRASEGRARGAAMVVQRPEARAPRSAMLPPMHPAGHPEVVLAVAAASTVTAARTAKKARGATTAVQASSKTLLVEAAVTVETDTERQAREAAASAAAKSLETLVARMSGAATVPEQTRSPAPEQPPVHIPPPVGVSRFVGATPESAARHVLAPARTLAVRGYGAYGRNTRSSARASGSATPLEIIREPGDPSVVAASLAAALARFDPHANQAPIFPDLDPEIEIAAGAMTPGGFFK